MSRALLTLAGGVVVTLGAVALIAGGVAPRGFLLVLLTILAGAAVMAVAVRGARQRERTEQLRRATAHLPDRPTLPIDPDDQEPNRG